MLKPNTANPDDHIKLESPVGWSRSIILGSSVYGLTTAIVVAGVVFGVTFLQFPEHRDPALNKDHRPLFRCVNWDGQFYRSIVQDGYQYNPRAMSNVAFLPVLPLMGAGVAGILGITGEYSLLIIANCACWAVFVMLHRYVAIRSPQDGPEAADWTLLALALVPTGFFLRMAYTESLFLLFVVLVLYGIAVRWPLVLVALIAGLATATRSVGVGLIPVVVFYAWFSSHGRIGRFAGRLAFALPLSCWGIIAFMSFQYFRFGEPLAFAFNQKHWSRLPNLTLTEKLYGLATLEPFFSFFDPASPCYWANREPRSSVLFNMHVADPFYFLTAVGLLACGWCYQSLTKAEFAVGLGLVLVPYLSNSIEGGFHSVGRYMVVVVTSYLIFGRLAHHVPLPLLAAASGFAGFMLGGYAALFAAWYDFY